MFLRRLTSVTKTIYSQGIGKSIVGLQIKSKILKPKVLVGTGIFAGSCLYAQMYYGSRKDFYDYRFITEANPDDLAEFYGNEDFMEIFCVFPFVVDFMMRSGYFDDNGHVHTFGLPPIITKMIVSMQFEEKEEDDVTVCFNKKERFKCLENLFGFTVWEMVQNFGYCQREDGRCEVYHHGEDWRGPFFIRLIFDLHARYVIYATEKHLNSKLFLEKNEEDEDKLIAQRHNIPLHLINNYIDNVETSIQKKLKNTINTLNNRKSDEELKNLKTKVTELEILVDELRQAKKRRNLTVSFKKLTKGENQDEKDSNFYDGSVRGMYTRSLLKRATLVNLPNTENLSKTIDDALEHIETSHEDVKVEIE